MISPEEITIRDFAGRFGIDPKLVIALATVESGMNPWKVRFEPQWKYFHYVREYAEQLSISYATEMACQQMSWGMMQVMGSVAREHGFKDDLTKLTNPQLGLQFGLTHLQKMLKTYPVEEDAVAAYNAGKPRKLSSGLYVNSLYVDKVYLCLRELRKTP
jgi:hypothetical protein